MSFELGRMESVETRTELKEFINNTENYQLIERLDHHHVCGTQDTVLLKF